MVINICVDIMMHLMNWQTIHFPDKLSIYAYPIYILPQKKNMVSYIVCTNELNKSIIVKRINNDPREDLIGIQYKIKISKKRQSKEVEYDLSVK